MAINLSSPGILVTERDLVASVPSAGATVGATVGQFRWGPIGEPVLVSSETELVASFGKPSANNIKDFLVAANYLSYSSALYVVRSANTTSGSGTALNATSEATTGSATPGTGTLIKNDSDYEDGKDDGTLSVGPWVAKYAGALGNSIRVSTCPSADAWSTTLSGTWSVAANQKSVTGVNTLATTELNIGDYMLLGNRLVQVATIDSDTAITLVDAHLTGTTDEASVVRYWQYYSAFDSAPGTSDAAVEKNASNDEMHVIVVDEDGLFTGTRGSVLEKYQAVSKASDAKTGSGNKNYYKDVINSRSKYIRWTDHDAAGTNWGSALAALSYTSPDAPLSYSLAGGSNGNATTDGEQILGYAPFSNKAKYKIDIAIMGIASATVINTVLADIVEKRKDMVMVFSGEQEDVVNNSGSETTDLVAFADTITSSNYAFMDGNWKYQYDKYNDNYVWVPCNPDVAGCMARTDAEKAAWFSPAGYAQGRILNSVKLAWNPDQNDRDILYKRAINPVFTKEGRGTVLFGDKTFSTKTGSFSRINVRRLFLTIERAIGAVADDVLFEQNDDATRAGFVDTVVPYLRSVQSQRGITDFAVVCDETNNTEDVVNANEFIADIYVRPTSSVNFIQLNFVSVRGASAIAELAG